MAKTSELCEYVVDRLAPLGAASYRFMFGGFAIYLDGRIIALVSDEVLWLKADEENRGAFEARGIEPFRPDPDKPQTMPYYRVPDDVFEDADEFLVWAKRSQEAALRKARRAPKKPKKSR
jgi:DNA transformation protein and related proteins